MSEKHSPLFSARTPLFHSSRPLHHTLLQVFCLAVGGCVVLVGAANITSKVAQSVFGNDAGVTAFAPAVVLDAPQSVSTVIASTTPIIPARLIIPIIGVNATVEEVGNTATGSMGVPHTFGDVAWYMLGPKPGSPGNTIIDGHVDNALTTAGVFEHLSQLKAGDAIVLSDTTGKTLAYTVTSTAAYGTNDALLGNIFTTKGPSQLVLITCDGSWVQSQHSFNQRFVVYASLTGE